MTFFPGTDTYHAFNGCDEDLAVPDLTRARSGHDRLHAGVHLVLGDDDLEPNLRQEIDDVLGTTIELGMPLLTAETLDLGSRQAPPGVRITRRAFGKDRRYPITSGYGKLLT